MVLISIVLSQYIHITSLLIIAFSHRATVFLSNDIFKIVKQRWQVKPRRAEMRVPGSTSYVLFGVRWAHIRYRKTFVCACCSGS